MKFDYSERDAQDAATKAQAAYELLAEIGGAVMVAAIISAIVIGLFLVASA